MARKRYKPKKKVFNTSYIKKGTSRQEISLYNTIKLLLPEATVIKNDRTILKGHELDVYVPSKKIAFEFDGVYWHSTANGKDPFYHLIKSIDCEKQGIHLVHVWSNEWEQKKPLVIDTIKRQLGLCKEILAEDCQCVEVSKKEAQIFFDSYTFEGFNKTAKTFIGLEFNNNLIMAGSFLDDKLVQVAERKEIIVKDGLAKILNSYPKRPLLASCDRRYFTGQMYKDAGFKELKPSNPIPYYTKDYSNLYLRESFKTTEDNDIAKAGYQIIYNCGLRNFKLN